jgi:Secretion system C-terminal sorting domain
VDIDTRNTVAKYVEKSGIADFSYWTLTDALNALPLSLVAFSARCATGQTQLQWQTGIESGMDRFDIERSTASSGWIKIGSLPCANIAGGSNYSFPDKDGLPTALYRLKIVSLQGTWMYSPIFKGGCADIAMPFMVYPNPANTSSTAQLSVREASTATIKLVDITGKELYSHQWKLQPGLNQHALPVATLAAGTYLIKLSLKNSLL